MEVCYGMAWPLSTPWKRSEQYDYGVAPIDRPNYVCYMSYDVSYLAGVELEPMDDQKREYLNVYIFDSISPTKYEPDLLNRIAQNESLFIRFWRSKGQCICT